MSDRFSKTMNVEGVPEIDISNDTGRIKIHSGSPGEVTVNGELRHSRCMVEQNKEKIRVVSRMNAEWYEWFYLWIEFLFSGWPKCNLEITIPEEAKVQVHTKTGIVEMQGIKGEMDVRNHTGAVRLKDVEGNIKAHTSTGSIILTGAEGNIDAEASTGEVRMENVTGKIRARSSTGSIHFNGTLTPGEEHLFSASTGSVHLSLKKPDVSFEARVGTGSIHCYPDSSITRREQRFVQGYFGNGSGRLRVNTSTGSIHIQG